MRKTLLVALALLVAIAVALLTVRPAGPRSVRQFNPDRLAALEVDMWQAYYRHERLRLVRDLAITLREQYRCSYASAARIAFRFGRAASTFADLKGDYEQVLPDLEQGYSVVRGCVDGTFDPAAVARAELAWWVARRVPGQNSPAQVGALIGDENALLFSVTREQVLAPSVLRAEAGWLRDQGGEHADWDRVSTLLHQSYRALHTAVN
jgi:hypothetical protein